MLSTLRYLIFLWIHGIAKVERFRVTAKLVMVIRVVSHEGVNSRTKNQGKIATNKARNNI